MHTAPTGRRTERVQRSHNHHHRHYHRSGTSKEKPPRYISGLRILKKASGKYNYKNKNWEWDKVNVEIRPIEKRILFKPRLPKSLLECK